MSFVSNSLDLIRRVFRRDQMTLPGGPDIYNGMDLSTQSMQQLGVAGPQSDASGFLSESVQLDQDLNSRYADYEEMDAFPEINAAFDLFADDATVQDVLDGRSIWFEAPDAVVQEILENMLTKQLRSEEDLWDLARGLVKWGNSYREIVAIDKVGVVDMRDVHVPTVRRIQDPFGMLYGFIQDPSMGFAVSTDSFIQKLQAKSSVQNYMSQVAAQSYEDMVQVYEPWELIHFRMRGMNPSDPYGVSVAEAARYAWRRLTMMEDAMVLYKVTRSPQRYAFYVDIGDQPPNMAKKLLNQVKNDFKKSKSVDKNGKLNFRYNPLAQDEDFFLPVRKGSRATEVDVLSGPEGQQTEDVEYFRNKLFAALKVPKSYLGGDDTVGRANLSQLDVRMARSVMRVQRVIKNGFMQAARVDLSAKNIDPDLVEFQCMMNIPSGALEIAQIEVQTAKLDLAGRYRDAGFPEYFMWSNVLGFSDDEITRYQAIRKREQGASEPAVEEAAQRSVSKMIDEAKANPKMAAQMSKLMDEVNAGKTDTAKRLRELKGLMGDIRHAMPRRRGR